jgi:hypothetical protein
MMNTRIPSVAILALSLFASPLASQDCLVPVVRRGPQGFTLGIETVEEGGAVALFTQGDSRVIAPIIPVGPGVSGDIVKASETDVLLLRCVDGVIRVMSTPPDGGVAEERMRGQAEDLTRYTLRVNIVAQDGEEAAFQLSNGTVTPADGPVLNMFGGMVPLEAGDVVLTTQVSEPAGDRVPELEGSVELVSVGPYAGVPAILPGNREGRFILDLGASRSLVARTFLDQATPVEPMVAVEHSAQGVRELAGSAQAAGGKAQGVGSLAKVPWVRVGSQELEDFQPVVLDEPFEVAGEAIQGILGLDVLRRAGRVVGNFGRPEGPAELRLGGEPLEDAMEIPLQEVRGLLFVEGRLGDLPVLFLLDSGARQSIIPEALARREGMAISQEAVDSLMGLDRNPIPFRGLQAPPLKVGGLELPNAGFITGPIPVLDALGIREDAAILGQPFFKALGTVEIDFEKGVLRVPGPSKSGP